MRSESGYGSGFTTTESTFSYFEATREYIERYGKPLAFYSDKASVFRTNKVAAVTGPGHTQFGRALYELNIDGICANTAAAKGRVERAHLTLQDRLVKEPPGGHLQHYRGQCLRAALPRGLQRTLRQGPAGCP